MLEGSLVFKIQPERLDVTERSLAPTFVDDRECVECGHVVSLHTDDGCIYRDTGTGETAPLACRCSVTGFELFMDHALTRPRRDRDRPN